MSSTGTKKNRMLEIFYRAMKGENISVKSLADEYGVSAKSIYRDLGEIKNFLYENRELVGNTELKYASNSKSYYLEFDNFLLSKELIAIIKMMIGCRALSKMEILDIISKLKNFTSFNDRSMLEKLIMKEMYHYNEVNHDCKSVIDNLWQLTRCINEKIEISVRNAVTVCVQKRFIPKVEKYLKRVAKVINSESIGDVNISFTFDTDKLNKGMTGSIVAVVAGLLLGAPIFGIIVGIFMKLSGDKKREEAKQAIRQKLRSEVFPQVLKEVGNGIEMTITKQIKLVNSSIEEELTNQRNTLEKAMEDLRQQMNDEKIKKENLAIDIKADLERIEGIKDGLR